MIIIFISLHDMALEAVSQRQCECNNRSISDPKYQRLENILPAQYESRLCSFVEQGEGFSATIRLRARTSDEAKEWQNQFQEVSKTTMRVDKTYPDSGRKNVYKIDLRCHRRTRTTANRISSKNTGCSAKMTIIVKRTDQKNIRSKDSHLPDFPMIVNIKYIHNHPISCADALRHRDVSEDVREKFLQLFKSGHSPSSALEMHTFDFQIEHHDDFMYNCADRARIPDLQWCYRLYYATYGQGRGCKNKSMMEDLKSVVLQLNSKREYPIIKMDITADDQLVIAICTPLMRRALQKVEESGEMVFVDSSGNVDRHNLRVFILMTHSCAGGIPIGCLITATESQKTIQRALELYCEILPDDAFYGRGRKGPRVFLTDDSEAERTALHSVFPEAVLILCAFHLLQSAWRWVWNGKKHIPLRDKRVLFRTVRELLYASSPVLLEEVYQTALNDRLISSYPGFLKYLNHIFARKELWSVCYRGDLKNSSHQSNNFCEAAMRILKDKIIMRTKAFNALQFVDFVVSRLDCFYERRLLDLANNRLDYFEYSKYMPISSNIHLGEILRISCNEFTVPSQSEKDESYHVNMEMGMCTCNIGISGGPCKHQAAIIRKFNISSLNFTPVNSPDLRCALYNLATGKNVVEMHWFASFEEQSSEVSEVKRELESYFFHLNAKLENDPSTFLPAIRCFLKNAQKLNCDSDTVSALNLYGKYCVDSPTLGSRGSRLGGLKRVGAHVTAIPSKKCHWEAK